MKNKETRKAEALERQQEYNSLTVEQKVLKLDLKLGGDKGAVKQRAKLAQEAVIAKTKPAENKPEKKKKPYQKPKKS